MYRNIDRRTHSPISVDVVVERKLLVLLDRAVREYAHPDVLVDGPLRHIAVRITTVIGEPTNPSALGGVNELRGRTEFTTDAITLEHDVPHPFAAS